MKLIKLAFISLFFLFLVITGFSFLFPSNVRISKAIDVGASPDSVLMYVRDTSMWPMWHPAFKDQGRQYLSRMKKVSGNDSSVIMEMARPGRAAATNGFITMNSGSPDTTVVQWYIDFTFKWYPWEKFSSLFLENTYGLQMQNGLKRLKTLAETGRPSND